MISLEGKVAVVTGAQGGLGTYVTRAFLESGASVAGVSRSIGTNDFTHERFLTVPADLLSAQGARQTLEATLARFGRIDILAHLMGGFVGGTTVAETEEDTFDQMLNLNLRSAFLMARAIVPQMRSQGSGRIIAIGSRAAVESNSRVAAYSASKAALIALMRAIALENKDRGITANVVLPSTIDTAANRKAMPGTDYTKWIQPRQLATLILSLSSDELSQISGAVIPVYGAEL
jgi:NAD(P)-dependent dehydrogenase (short-subunit alcohol dehydrogenase family)